MSSAYPSTSRRPRPDLDALPGDLRERLRRLDGQLRDLALGEGAPPGLELERFLVTGTPRVRPLLVLLSAQAAAAAREGEWPAHPEAAAEHVALAVELLHGAVLVHDAAIGGRRGLRRRAARRLVGGALGLLGANHLTLRALELARLAPAPEVIGDLVEAMREAAAAHALGHGILGRMPTLSEGLALAEGHSGALFAFACRAGARLGGGERPDVTALGRYGRHAGLAWALAEDLAVLDAEEEELVSALEERAAIGRPPLPVLMAGERDPEVGEAWRRLHRRFARDAALALGERARRAGGMAEGRRRLALESWTARSALATLHGSSAREALDRLAAALV